MTTNMVGIAALALMTAAVCLILTCGAQDEGVLCSETMMCMCMTISFNVRLADCSDLGLETIPNFLQVHMRSLNILVLAKNSLTAITPGAFDGWTVLSHVDLRWNPHLNCSILRNIPEHVLVASGCLLPDTSQHPPQEGTTTAGALSSLPASTQRLTSTVQQTTPVVSTLTGK